ncbi:uncharacterized protein LY89DRAFT_684370 [Mollisia scopiformis]|uniref:Uncharacterized protein n=1 Tax=Mollisia scopiformis TaxID=149040 RepID=A0A194XC00_MOLSC|nr:uncharacterized protein LY89DRAFT_684370 [Mollisia scopiformis]KUJ17282.1 hypothetical protein LY89DRAFT_684370 [Mollisia scopiformis]
MEGTGDSFLLSLALLSLSRFLFHSLAGPRGLSLKPAGSPPQLVSRFIIRWNSPPKPVRGQNYPCPKLEPWLPNDLMLSPPPLSFAEHDIKMLKGLCGVDIH